MIESKLSRGKGHQLSEVENVPIRCFTVEEVAKAFKKSIQFVRKEIHAGRLRAVRIGVELRMTEAQLVEYLESNEANGPAKARDPRRNGRKPVGNRSG